MLQKHQYTNPADGHKIIRTNKLIFRGILCFSVLVVKRLIGVDSDLRFYLMQNLHGNAWQY